MSVFEGYHKDLPGQSSFPFLSIDLKQLFSATNKKKLVSAPKKTRDALLLQLAESYNKLQNKKPPTIKKKKPQVQAVFSSHRATRRPAMPKPREASSVTVRTLQLSWDLSTLLLQQLNLRYTCTVKFKK